MVLVENNVFQAPEKTAASGPAHSAADNRLGWLRAMEAEGLTAALEHTQRFPGGEFRAREDAPAVAPRPVFAKAINDAGRASPLDGIAPPRTAAWSAARPYHQAPAAGVADVEPRPAPAVGDEARPPIRHARETDGATPRQLANPRLLNAEDWSQRHVALLKSEGGDLELWVRDASLSKTVGEMFVADIRRMIGGMGNKLVKAVLNGKMLFLESRKPVSQDNRGKE